MRALRGLAVAPAVLPGHAEEVDGVRGEGERDEGDGNAVPRDVPRRVFGEEGEDGDDAADCACVRGKGERGEREECA